MCILFGMISVLAIIMFLFIFFMPVLAFAGVVALIVTLIAKAISKL